MGQIPTQAVLATQRVVGHLVGLADGEGDVGEVAVAGMLLAVLGAERCADRA